MRILGLDIGTSSIGWSIFEWPEGGETDHTVAPKVVDCGVRIFPEGVGRTSSGAEESLGAQRRAKRQLRRQIDRRRRRRQKLFNRLRYFGLLPESKILENDIGHPQIVKRRARYVADLDKVLLVKWTEKCALDSSLWSYLEVDASGKTSHERQQDRSHRLALRLPYLLRSVAAERHLDPHDVGRALLNLGARRGYLSNRKTQTETDASDTSELLRGQASLELTLTQRKQTLGQYLAQLTPTEERLRNHPTTRKMYLDEFQRIQQTQMNNSKLNLTAEDWCEIKKAIFFQRPLKSQSHLRKACKYEKNQTGAPRAVLVTMKATRQTGLFSQGLRVPQYGRLKNIK